MEKEGRQEGKKKKMKDQILGLRSCYKIFY